MKHILRHLAASHETQRNPWLIRRLQHLAETGYTPKDIAFCMDAAMEGNGGSAFVINLLDNVYQRALHDTGEAPRRFF